MLPSEAAGSMPFLCVIVGSLSLGLFGCPAGHPPKLAVSATVNERAAGADPPVRAGDPVVVSVRVGDPGGRGLADVRLTVAGALGGAVVCPSGSATVGTLAAGQSVDCVIRTTALPGVHDGTVTVTGRSEGDHDDDAQGNQGSDGDGDDDGYEASTTVGYRGVEGGLSASATVTVAADGTGGTATVNASVRNTGNVPVFDLAAADPLVPGITCSSPAAGLAPGAVALCSGGAQLAPGTYHNVLTVTGGDRTTTVGTGGQDVVPPVLSTTAGTDFTVAAPPPPPTTPPPPPTSPPASAAPPPVVPPAPVTSPTPTPTPTPPPPSPVAPRPTPVVVPHAPAAAAPPPQGLRPGLFLLVMMMPASGAAAVLAARRK